MSELIERLAAALNAHDLDAAAGLLHEDYRSEQPAHPGRAFVGRAQMRANWAAMFTGVPDLHAELGRCIDDVDTTWSEWHWSGTRTDGEPFDMRGVTLFEITGSHIVAGRLFMEDVERSAAGIEQAVRSLSGVPPRGSTTTTQHPRTASREVDWPEVADRLTPERSYWLATTATDGSPHVTPVWGVVVADALYVYSERRTAKARHVARDNRVDVHLPDADDVVIVHGTLIDLGRPADHHDVEAALERKYDRPGDQEYLPSADAAFDVLWRLEPARAMLWRLSDWDGSQARWRRPAADKDRVDDP